jgi:hypothetical protein
MTTVATTKNPKAKSSMGQKYIQMKQVSYVIALAAALAAAGFMSVPTAQAQGVCVDEVTAGGWIPDGGADLFANFGLNARAETHGGATELTGELNFVDADMDCHVVGDEVLSYTADGDCRTIVYDVTLSLFDVRQEGEFEATVTVCDYGEPNTSDTFSIEVFDVTDPDNPVLVETCGASGTLSGGSVQLHVYGNCP